METLRRRRRKARGNLALTLALGALLSATAAGSQPLDLEPYTSMTDLFHLGIPTGWSVEEHLPGRALLLANSDTALERYRSGSAVEPGDLVLNIGFLPFLLLQQRELRPLDIRFEATPDAFLQSLMPMFRVPDETAIGNAELVRLPGDVDAGLSTVASDGREGMILMIVAGDGVVALVSTVGYPGERDATRDTVYAIAAGVRFGGSQEALYGALLGG